MTDNLPAFDELNNIRTKLSGMVGEMTEGRQFDRKRLEDTIFELITMGYAYGIEVAGLDLEQDIPLHYERMVDTAWAKTAGETFADRLHTHLSEAEEALASEDPETVAKRLTDQLSVIAETETHRSMNTGVMDGAEEFLDENPQRTIYKQWMTMRDDRVREEHEDLEGAVVPVGARFYSWSGDSARFPGDFMSPELNIGCRCLIRLIEK